MPIRPLLLLTVLLFPMVARAAERPNILFFFVDDQRHNTLGCAGHKIVKTPNVDWLAKHGVRFDHAYVTTPICWVSRATVLTGMWSRTHGTAAKIDAVNPAAASTIYPKLLQKAGYRNGFFGKWHARMPRGFNQAQYFDEYKGISRNPYFKKQPDGSLRHETEIIGDHAVAFLKSQPRNKPFCLNLWFNASHAEDGDKRPGIGHFPWPKAVDGMYDKTKIPPPRLSAPEIYEKQPDFLKKSLNRERYFWRWDTPEKYTTNMRAYFRMLSGVDGVIARVMKVLKAQGLADNTIIVYSADNGYYMGDRGFAGKWSHYEESIRVPMIIYDPRLPENLRGRVVTRPVLNVDFAPTFLDLAGVEKPARYQGRSLLPLLQQRDVADWRKDVFAEHLLEFGTRLPKWEGVRGERYVYARYIEHDYEFLHDLKNDPDELQNLAKNPRYAAVLQQMRKRNLQMRNERGGEYIPQAKRKKRGGKGKPSPTHVMIRPTLYYKSGPQQGRPPDGRFPAGTEVTILRKAGSYVQIQTKSGVRAFVAATSLKAKGKPVPRDVTGVAQSNNRFALELYQRLGQKKGNLFFSPSSISAALAMTYAGAEGRTEKEMADVLKFNLPENRLHAAQGQFRAILNAGGKGKGYELQVANRLWGQQGYGFRPEYLKTTREHYGAELAEVDFIRKTETVRKTINDWVEKQTKGKIKDLIPQGSLDQLTRLVLTNAIYFKGDWTTPFDPKKTRKAPFHLSKSEKVDVPLMFHKGKFRYGEAKDLQVLQLPYGKDEALSMVVLLPKEVDGLAALEKSLSDETLTKQLSNLRTREVLAFLPKFKMTWEFELSTVLKSMGMPTAFTPGAADFSGMATNEKLFISAVIHKAFVDVNEKGTEAAAATGVVIRATSAPPPPPTFRADRPFVFLIRDNRTGAILFLGRVANPGK